MSEGREAALEIGLNVVAPTIVLVFLSGEDRLGPAPALVLALAFPLLHAARALLRRGGVSPLTVIAVVSVLLTGGIGLLALDARWFALKEAAVPALLGVAAVASIRTPWPLIPTLLGRVLDGDRLHAALVERGTADRAQQRMVRATWAFGALFLLSAVLTFALARFLVISPSGTAAFNEELGRFTAWSFPAVGLPVTGGMVVALRALLLGLEEDAGRPIDDLLPSGASRSDPR